nr:MAG TPA: hypothetical protein [Caudoviricetes sp.]
MLILTALVGSQRVKPSRGERADTYVLNNVCLTLF